MTECQRKKTASKHTSEFVLAGFEEDLDERNIYKDGFKNPVKKLFSGKTVRQRCNFCGLISDVLSFESLNGRVYRCLTCDTTYDTSIAKEN